MISPLLDGLLDPKHVALDLRGSTAGEAVWEIVELLRESGELNKPSEFFEAVMAREEKASTVANGGVAFPHARTELVDQILLGIGRSRKGIVFDGRERSGAPHFRHRGAATDGERLFNLRRRPGAPAQ